LSEGLTEISLVIINEQDDLHTSSSVFEFFMIKVSGKR